LCPSSRTSAAIRCGSRRSLASTWTATPRQQIFSRFSRVTSAGVDLFSEVGRAPLSTLTNSSMDLTATKLFDIQGRNALITGGTSGIGFMMAKGLIANGIGRLYVTGNEPGFQQRIKALISFAESIDSDCAIIECVSHFRFNLLTSKNRTYRLVETR